MSRLVFLLKGSFTSSFLCSHRFYQCLWVSWTRRYSRPLFLRIQIDFTDPELLPTLRTMIPCLPQEQTGTAYRNAAISRLGPKKLEHVVIDGQMIQKLLGLSLCTSRHIFDEGNISGLKTSKEDELYRHHATNYGLVTQKSTFTWRAP
ncbi:uncharacterized protein ARMOST_04529 [Armillaria ostoyae]|uniref:Uncharacterized protein n=1 Tax=Armillaria ostoyae TaxID=47428 RepID=A0A284QXK3_ARMOS|nr:uncharacterized protein ARMOST_04529 [Armillaria ostoyae]